MPSKYTQRNFAEGHYYHIFNRGVRKSNIFLDKKDYLNFTNILSYYLCFPSGKPLSKLIPLSKEGSDPSTNPTTTPTYQLICYCLMPNHFHLLIKQHSSHQPNNNIPNFIKRISVTYVMYFNNKYKQSGNLFQGKYKNVTITSEEQLLYLSKYIHRNPLEINPKSPLSNYPYSSYSTYIYKNQASWINPQPILNYYSNNNPSLSYQSFVEETPNSINITSLTLE